MFTREGWFVFPVVIVLGLLAIAGALAANYGTVGALLSDVPYAVPGILALVAVTAAAVEVTRDVRTGKRLRHIARLRPNATVRPVQSFGSMLVTAQRLRVGTQGVGYSEWSCQVLVILPDRVEFWATSGDEPRWSVRRAHMDISLVLLRVDLRRIDVLRLADALSPTKIEVRPVSRPVWTSYRARYRQEAMEQLVRNLDHDPQELLVEDAGRSDR
ncbi:hypothetical protein [Promicromonospora iranensis]|uniref:hypothetical protein n=1 Tax=Promicromonospora iranensis TaxID=1105144 RepID=UPI0023A941BF|nr:hypothetical protein [Promicromonospora iranensis]